MSANDAEMFSDDGLLPASQTLRAAFETLVRTLNERSLRYALIGGLAMAQRARPRYTKDVDVLLDVPLIDLPKLLEQLAARGFTVDLVRSIRDWRDAGCTALTYQGVFVDLLGPGLPLFERILDTAQLERIGDVDVRVASPEGLILSKLTSMRLQDQADVLDVLKANARRLDLDYIRAQMDSFTTADDPRRDQFESWVREAEATG